MKKKLNIVFILMAVSLLGIIIFQSYWTFDAYKVNKDKFDTNLNGVMQKAMDDCKKDYFDSIRIVLIKHLSPPDIYIKIDTIAEGAEFEISFIRGGAVLYPGEPYIISKSSFNFYRTKISHKATVPEVLTEAGFYIPTLMQKIIYVLGTESYFSPIKDRRNNLPDSVIHKPNLFPGQPLNINGELATFRGNPIIYTGPPIYYNGQPVSGKFLNMQTTPGFDTKRYHLGDNKPKPVLSSKKNKR